jgi:ribosomal subunit interface protein
MNLSVKGRQLDLGDALRQHVADKLDGVFEKYFGDAIEVVVTLSREAHLYRSHVQAHVGRGITMQTTADAGDIYGAFDLSADKLAKRLRRYKRRLRDHHKTATALEGIPALQYVLAAPAEDNDGDGETDEPADGASPPIIAEMEGEVPELTVSEALMRLDLSEEPALMFRNRAHGGLNMIYRRRDGNVGWVDPRGNRSA